ncbi:hypothetical protein ACQEU6_32915 [Spirillospora sp. CA-108201]
MIAFKPDVKKIKTARDHIAEITTNWPVNAYHGRVVTSELVTNAIRHAVTDEIRVDAYTDGRICVVKVLKSAGRWS